MLGQTKTSRKGRVPDIEAISADPTWVLGMKVPSPINTAWLPLYGWL